MTLLLMLLHICGAGLILYFRRRGRFHFPAAMVPVVMFLPLWGPVCGLVAEIHIREGEKADEEPETGRFGITDEVYRSIRMEHEDVSGILPMEDVLACGTPVQRRSLLLSVLHSGAAPFVRPLRTAGVNDDTEVVHYAVTALVELRNRFEQRIAQMDEEIRKHPSDTEILLAGVRLDEEYLQSGIPENTERQDRLVHCRQLLERILQNRNWQEKAGAGYRKKGNGPAGTVPERKDLLIRLGRICLEQGDAGSAESAGRMLIEENPGREDGYMLILEAKAVARDGEGIEETIREIRSQDIYLSPASRDQIAFWSA